MSTTSDGSSVDAAARRRVGELSVHTRCARLRGPVPDDCQFEDLRGRWQFCCDRADHDRWPGCDVSEAVALCLVCARGTAGGPSRWSWLACEDCRSVNTALKRAWGCARSRSAGVPLWVWQEVWPPGRAASIDAVSRLLGRDDVAESVAHGLSRDSDPAD